MKLIITGGLAIAFGATSYVGGNYYLDSQTEAMVSEIESQRPVVEPIELAKVVVASGEFQFGEPITSSMLKLVDWPEDAFPEGAFSSIEEASKNNQRRAIGSIKPGEPILASKVTGEDGRGGLSSVIADGMRAVTVPVNTVNGVGGFIQPGDRVDLVLTSEDRENGTTEAQIILEYVKVLSIDQEAGQLLQAATVADSVTLETDTSGATAITRALSVGSLSLILRNTDDDKRNAKAESADESGGIFSTEKPIPKMREIKVTEGRKSRNVNVVLDEATIQQIKNERKIKKKLN